MKVLPPQLTGLRQWVCWQHVERNGQMTKIPVQPNGDAAKSNDPATWATFAEAIAADEKIGFVFARKGGLFGVDLDECLAAGELAPWASEIVERFPAAYVEVSPSGRGLKLFCRGSIKKGRARKIGPKLDGADKAPGVEVYGQGRYFTVTGEAFQSNADIGDCSAGLAWLLGKYWPATTPAIPVESTTVSYRTQETESTDVERRVLAYLGTCDPAVSGEGGSNRTFAVAGSLIHGFCLSPERASTLMQSWNARCDPPWDEAGLRRKCEQAAAAPCTKPRGWLLNESRAMTPEGGDVDLSEFGDNEIVVSPVSSDAATTSGELIEVDDNLGEHLAADPGPFPVVVFDRLSGFIANVVRFSLSTARYPQPELSLAGALVLMAVLAGRKVRDRGGVRTNVYALGVNVSSSGKEHPRKVNKDILFAAGAGDLAGPEGFASSAGLLRAVETNPAILFQIDEVGRMLSVIRDGGNPHLFKIGGELLKLYSSANTVYKGESHADSKHDLVLPYPCVSIYGTHTPGLWDSVSTENVREGLLGRFMLFEGRGFVGSQDVEETAPPSDVVEFATAWHRWTPPGGDLYPPAFLIPHSAEAKERFSRHQKDIEERRKTECESNAVIWSRTAERTAKLALLFAASRISTPGDPTASITKDDVDLAVTVSNWSTRKMIWNVTERVSENRTEANSKRMLRFISPDPNKPTTQRSISREFRGLEGRVRDDIIRGLVSGGMVAETRVKTKGRPAMAYYRNAS